MPIILIWLKSNWRWLVYFAGILAAAVLMALVLHWKHNSDRLPEVQAALVNEQGCGPASECEKRVAALKARQQALGEQVVKGYQDEIQALNARPIPTRVIRVCRDPGAGNVRGGSPSAGTGGDASSPGGLDRADEYPTAPFREYARDAAKLAAQCRSIIRLDEARSQAPK